jgi:hypothetical protein
MSKLADAARRAVEINPANHPVRRTMVPRTPIGRIGGPRRIAIVTSRRWPATGVRLTTRFLDTPSKELRKNILAHLNAWSATANVTFVETRGDAMVRIARLNSPDEMAGYWSYIGTEILEIADDQPTMNLDSFTMGEPDAEFRRVVRHEAGHTLGFDHEHMRSDLVKKIDPAKAYRFYDRDQGWSRAEVDLQVLTPLVKASIMGTTESDPISIMCYHIPGAITKTGEPIPGGIDINKKDAAFAGKMYPKRISAPKPVTAPKRAKPKRRASRLRGR